MKKKFYNVGTLLYVRDLKCGIEIGTAALIGGLAAAGGSVAAASINSSTQADINAENEHLTRESWDRQENWMHQQMNFNAAEAQIARDFNSEEAYFSRLFSQDQAALERSFQAEEAQKTRDFNAVDAQIQRAKDAGVNPAFYINNGFPTSNVTAGGASAPTAAASSSPASAVGAPAPAVIPKRAPDLSALSHLGQIGSQLADINLKSAQADNVKEHTKSTITFNKFQEAVIKSGLDVNDATIAKMYADVKQIESYVDKIHKDIELISANITLVNNEAKIKEIEAYFKSDECKAMIDKLESETSWNRGMLNYYFTKLPFELGVFKSESAVNEANAILAKSRASLTEHEIKQVDAVTSLYQTENANALIDHTVKRMYDVKNAGEDFKQNKAATKQAEYQSSDAVQIIGTSCQIVNSVTGIATSAAGAGAAVKYIKGGNKPPKIKGF